MNIFPRGRSFVQFTKTEGPVQAVAYLALERILVSTSIIILGPVEKLQPIVGLISVGEIIGLGTEPIIRCLAKYLFLLLPYERDAQDEILASLDPHCFHELALLCILPEILPQFHDFIGENFDSNTFTQPWNVCLLLKHLVVAEVYDINSPTDKITLMTLTHYTSRIGVFRILYRWARKVWVSTCGYIELDGIISSLNIPHHVENLLDPTLELELISKIIEKYDAETYDLSKLPTEDINISCANDNKVGQETQATNSTDAPSWINQQVETKTHSQRGSFPSSAAK